MNQSVFERSYLAFEADRAQGISDAALALIGFISGSSSIYFLLLALSFLALWMSVFETPRWWNKTTGFLCFGALLLVAGRWPSLVPLEMNPDESQVIVGAELLRRDPTPFLGADGTTHGPLLYYLVLLPSVLSSLPLDFGLLRLEGLVILLLTSLALYLIVRQRSETAARVCTAAFLSIEALASNGGLVSFSTEQLPMLFLAAMLVLDYAVPRIGKPSLGRVYVMGFLAGSIAYLKLQFIPVAAILLLFRGGDWFVRFRAGKAKLNEFFLAVAGLLTVPVLITAWVIGSGGWDDFWNQYIVANATHGKFPRVHRGGKLFFLTADQFPFLERAQFFFQRYFLSEPEIRGLSWSALLLGLAGLFGVQRAKKGIGPLRDRFVYTSAAFFASCLFVAVLPGHAYDHYIQGLLFPAILLLGALFSIEEIRPSWKAGLLILVALVPFLFDRFDSSAPKWQISLAPESLLTQAFGQKYPFVAQESLPILPLLGKDEHMAVWGWLPRLYVATGTVPATRDIISERQLEARYNLPYFRSRYLKEFTAAKPDVFVDATEVFVYQGDPQFDPESFPELWEFLQKNYTVLFQDPSLRIFVSNERAAALAEQWRSQDS